MKTEQPWTMPEISRPTTMLAFLIGINTALLVASNAAGAKLISLPFGLAASATVFSYSVTFLVTDVISEVFGPKAGKLAVRAGFTGVIFSVLLFRLAMAAPAATGWLDQEAYVKVLGLSLRLMAGGFLSYLVSQHLDVWIFHKIKAKTGSKHLWLRNNLSTGISQFIDTVIFITVAFWGVFPILPVILGQYAIKLVIAILDTPLAYLFSSAVRRWCGEKT